AASVTITSGNGTISTGVALIHTVAPSLFAANADGKGVAAAVALRIKADGSQQYEAVAQFDAAQNRFVALPPDLRPAGDQVYLALFGAGFVSAAHSRQSLLRSGALMRKSPLPGRKALSQGWIKSTCECRGACAGAAKSRRS